MESIPSGDLQVKYQKLASEYSKIRSHVHVLKKGIFDEQAKTADLKELLKEQEKNIRKGELEIDSLNFRNQQLTKRITVLQDELDNLQLHKNAKKGKHKNEAQHSSSDVSNSLLFQEELQKRIIENAQLASQLADKEFELSQLSLRMEDAEQQLGEVETKYKCETLKLKSHNHDLLMGLEAAGRDKASLYSHGTPCKIVAQHNQLPSLNGDFLSEGGSLLGSEDALSAEESHLNDQLSKKNQMLTKLEQENQTLKIEYDLLKMENESLKSGVTSISNSDKRASDAGGDSTLGVCNTEGAITDILGKIQCPFILPEEITSREETLKAYFRNKISALVGERQQCESLNRHYIDESEALHSRLENVQKEKESTDQAFINTQSTICRLEDELHSTSTNYEQQLSLLTEHVGNLNDKLTQQFEEIQHLKGQLSKKK